MSSFYQKWFLRNLVIHDAIKGRGDNWFPPEGYGGFSYLGEPDKITEKLLLEKGIIEKRPINNEIERESMLAREYGVNEVYRIKDIALANKQLKGSLREMMKTVAVHYSLKLSTKEGKYISLIAYPLGINVPPKYVKALKSLWENNKIYAMKCFKYLAKHERGHFTRANVVLGLKFNKMFGGMENWGVKGSEDYCLNHKDTKEASAFKTYEGHANLASLNLSYKFDEDPLEHLIFRSIWHLLEQKFEMGYLFGVRKEAYELFLRDHVDQELSNMFPWLKSDIKYKIIDEVWEIWKEIDEYEIDES